MPKVEAGLLYHYTSEQGLYGIIESGNIWATHIRFLNDYTEFRQASKDGYIGALTDSFRAGLLPEALTPLLAQAIDRVLSPRDRPYIRNIIEPSNYEAFVCSFASAGVSVMPQSGDPGDRLSQWRGYSHSSQGFSLGFDRERLEKQIKFDNGKAKAVLLDCKYEDTETVSFFQNMGHNASTKFNNRWLSGEAPVPDSFLPTSPDQEYRKAKFYFLQSLQEATGQYYTEVARIKHRGFSEECEWRIVLKGQQEALAQDVKFRPGQLGSTPYIEISLGLKEPKTSPLRRIVVGPSIHKEDIKHAVELLLRKHGIQVRGPDINDGVEVAASFIPYRPA